MPSGLLIGLVLVPSMLLAYVMLTSFYGPNRAYIAISWVPFVSIVIILMFIRVIAFQQFADPWWNELAGSIGWASLVQSGLGIILIVRALQRRESALGLSLATLLVISPFLLRFAS